MSNVDDTTYSDPIVNSLINEPIRRWYLVSEDNAFMVVHFDHEGQPVWDNHDLSEGYPYLFRYQKDAISYSENSPGTVVLMCFLRQAEIPW
jgi:hypothetical protein